MTATAAPPGAMPASDIVLRRGITGVLYGHPGSGKTKTASGARKLPGPKNKVLFLDAEVGSGTLAGMDDVLVVPILQFAQLEQTYKWLSVNLKQTDIGTVVIDTLTAAQRMGLDVLAETSKIPGLPDIQTYGKSNEQVGKLVRMYSRLAETRVDASTGEIYGGLNVFFICHLSESKDDVTNVTSARPALTPKAAELVCGVVDMIGLVVATSDGGQRRLIMDNTGSAIAKIRHAANRPVMPKKILIPNTTGDDGLEDESIMPAIVRVIQHHRGEINLNDRELYPEYYPKPKPSQQPENGAETP